jgi:hypothetical protein
VVAMDGGPEIQVSDGIEYSRVEKILYEILNN